MFDYRGNLSTRQKIASTLIATPIAMGAGWLFGKYVQSKTEEVASDGLTPGRLQTDLRVGFGIEADQAEIRDAIQKGASVVSLVGGAVIGKAVGETSKAAVYHSTN
jgi:hypothetical protein